MSAEFRQSLGWGTMPLLAGVVVMIIVLASQSSPQWSAGEFADIEAAEAAADVARVAADIAEIDADIAELDADIAEVALEIAKVDLELAKEAADLAEAEADAVEREVGALKSKLEARERERTEANAEDPGSDE